MAKKLTIKITVVPTDGKSTEKKVDVAPSGASLREVLAAAGIDTANKDFTINGKFAKLDTHVTPTDVLQARERGKAPVQASERPRGS